MTAPLEPLRERIRRYGLDARKSLGQHFLLDRNLLARIARSAGDLAGAVVLEVGPGPGGLTEALLEAGARVVAVERDTRCVAALQELRDRYPDRLTVVAGDALEVDEASLLSGPAHIVANLPYNIATPLLFKWHARPELFLGLTLMLQKEVAERIAAAPGGGDYGRLSVMMQWRFAVRRLFDVPRQAFVPPPRVTSSVVALTPRPAPLAPADAAALSRVVAAAFGQRRKMLRGSLRALGVDVAALTAAAGVKPERRAEELSVEEFCAMARAYAELSARAAAPTTGR